MVLNKRLQFIKTRKNGRAPSNWPVDGCGIPLRVTRYIPMTLKEVTSKTLEKGTRETDVVCISEMMSLFECFEKHEFQRGPCENFAKSLEQCYTANMIKKAEGKERRKQIFNKK